MKERTKLTITIGYSLYELKKAYAFSIGEKNWRKVKKSDLVIWAGGLAESDIDSDIDKALEEFENK